MSQVIYQCGSSGNVKWKIERQPGEISDPLVVRFHKWNYRRNLLIKYARWTRKGWDTKRWVPQSPMVPQTILDHVEAHMQGLRP
jgi:hypothetical protein